LRDNHNIYDFFLKQSNVYPRRNPFIFESDANPLKLIDFLSETEDNAFWETFPFLKGVFLIIGFHLDFKFKYILKLRVQM
jgi:hypothetical protein